MKTERKVSMRNDDGERAVIEFKAETKPNREGARTVDLEPVPKDEIILSFSGDLFEGRSRDPWCCGQCQDEIRRRFGELPGVERVLELWERYHLNDLKAGTVEQSKIVAEYIDKLPDDERYDYADACRYLKERDMIEDRGYKYGSAWLVEIFTKADVQEVLKAFAIVEAGQVMHGAKA